MSGKGDKPRPRQISQEEWDKRYNEIFKKKNQDRNPRPQENQH